jgi:signal transduction histidine kinase
MAALASAPIPADETGRLGAVRRYDILDTPPDGAFDRITSLAARVFDVPIAIVSIVDHDRIWFKSHHGIDVDQVGREPGLCASAILQDGPWIVADAPNDPRALANSLVAGDFGLRFYAGVPLRTIDGYNLGTLCILDVKPRELSAQETATLEDLAGTVLSELEVRLASRQAVAAAKEREAIKDAFAGMMSHELRTPITTIYAAAQMLSRQEGIRADPRAQELLPDIVAESERLMRLIENLLVLTRLESGRLETEHEPVLLQRVIPHAVHDAARRWPDRTITADIPLDLPSVSGDPTYVEQVVTNLLSNALKYSAEGTEVELTARVVGDEVETRIRDRGIGLDPARRNDVFDFLVRTDEAINYGPGAGIGLYVCRRLLEAMDGRIWIDSPPDGPGTVFVFRLPVPDA